MEIGDKVWMASAYISHIDGRPVAHVHEVILIDLGDSERHFDPLVETSRGDRFRVGRLSSCHDTEAEAKHAAADRLEAEAAKITAAAAALRVEANLLLAAEERVSV